MQRSLIVWFAICLAFFAWAWRFRNFDTAFAALAAGLSIGIYVMLVVLLARVPPAPPPPGEPTGMTVKKQTTSGG